MQFIPFSLSSFEHCDLKFTLIFTLVFIDQPLCLRLVLITHVLTLWLDAACPDKAYCSLFSWRVTHTAHVDSHLSLPVSWCIVLPLKTKWAVTFIKKKIINIFYYLDLVQMHNWLVGSIDVIALKEPLWSIVSIISELHSPQVLTHSAFKESEKTKSKQEIRQKGHHFIETLRLLSEEGKHIKTSPSHSWMTYFFHLKLLQALNCLNSDAERGRQKSSVIYTWKRQSSWGMKQGIEWNNLPSCDKWLGKRKRKKKQRSGLDVWEAELYFEGHPAVFPE